MVEELYSFARNDVEAASTHEKGWHQGEAAYHEKIADWEVASTEDTNQNSLT